MNNETLLETINDMIDAIESGNSFDAEKMFNAIMMTKIDDTLNQKKNEVAQSMFTGCSECDEETEVDEELKGAQKNIDMNKNGKLDAQDFKMLRFRKKGMKEETQVDEAIVSAAKRPSMDAASAIATYRAEKQKRAEKAKEAAKRPRGRPKKVAAAPAPSPAKKKARSPEMEKARQLAKADMQAMRSSGQ